MSKAVTRQSMGFSKQRLDTCRNIQPYSKTSSAKFMHEKGADDIVCNKAVVVSEMVEIPCGVIAVIKTCM